VISDATSYGEIKIVNSAAMPLK